MQFMDEREQLVAEQAVLQYRAVQEAAALARFGHGMEAIETTALTCSREHGRRLVELAMTEQAAEKGSAHAPIADGKPV